MTIKMLKLTLYNSRGGIGRQMDGSPAFRFQIEVIGDVVDERHDGGGHREPLVHSVEISRILVVSDAT